MYKLRTRRRLDVGNPIIRSIIREQQRLPKPPTSFGYDYDEKRHRTIWVDKPVEIEIV